MSGRGFSVEPPVNCVASSSSPVASVSKLPQDNLHPCSYKQLHQIYGHKLDLEESLFWYIWSPGVKRCTFTTPQEMSLTNAIVHTETIAIPRQKHVQTILETWKRGQRRPCWGSDWILEWSYQNKGEWVGNKGFRDNSSCRIQMLKHAWCKFLVGLEKSGREPYPRKRHPVDSEGEAETGTKNPGHLKAEVTKVELFLRNTSSVTEWGRVWSRQRQKR